MLLLETKFHVHRESAQVHSSTSPRNMQFTQIQYHRQTILIEMNRIGTESNSGPPAGPGRCSTALAQDVP